jgi:hypothetical protein
MPPKRSHEDLDGIHESRQPQVHQDDPKPAKKPRREGPPKIRKQVHASSVNAVKKRIRDVTRLLSRSEDLPADVRVENERALAAYQQELNAADEEKTRQRMIKKYHMVRFFGKFESSQSLLTVINISHRETKGDENTQKIEEAPARSDNWGRSRGYQSSDAYCRS